MRSCVRVAVAVFCLACTWSATARGEVVFGNLGPTASGALTSGTTQAITSTTWVAQGFKVASPYTYLESASFGLFDSTPSNVTVDLYLDGGALLATRTGTVSNATPTLQTFSFDYMPLTANSTYLLLLSSTDAGGFEWAFNADGLVGTAQNSSGWTARASNPTIITTNGGGLYSPSAVNRPLAYSINATTSAPPSPVPEIDPVGLGSALALVISGLGMLERRRRRA